MLKNLIVVITLLQTALSYHAQLVDVIVEEYGTPEPLGEYPEGFMTYRVFARLQDSDDFLTAVYSGGGSDSLHSLCIGRRPDIQEKTVIWNSSWGATVGSQLLNMFCGFYPETCYDSFVTIGRANNLEPGGSINTMTPVMYLNTFNFESKFAYPLMSDDCSWFTIINAINGYPQAPDNRVLLMQITCPEGELMYCINVKVNDGDSGTQWSYCHGLQDGMNPNLEEQDFTMNGLVYPPIVPIVQCTDPLACNYTMNASSDIDCVYSADCNVEYGCTMSAACNYNPQAIYQELFSCVFPGCTDPLACNYNELACEDNTLCNYNYCAGCTDQNACNYISYMTLDNGACSYEEDITVNVFYDMNGDGNFSGIDHPMEGVGISLQPENMIAYTNEFGIVTFLGVPDGTHTLELVNPDPNWEITTTVPSIVTPNCFVQATFGIHAGELYFGIEPPFNLSSNLMHCTDGYYTGITLQNAGSGMIDGVVTLTCDPLFTFAELPWSNAIEPDVSVPGSLTWNVEDLLPFQQNMYAIYVNGPGLEYSGQSFLFSMHIVLYDDQGTEFYNETFEQELEVMCAYDPNDKATTNPGYTEEHHFVASDEELEYKIRFQNTGNYLAQDIFIQDTLDIEFLDLTTFDPITSSHNMMTSVDPSGVVTFTFEDIMLPDSISDEPGSHGFLIYRIRPKSTVQHMDVLQNTAYIFFDENPPIVTNTTWHTIMDCSSLTGIVGEENFCVGDVGYFSGDQSFIDVYNWTLDGTDTGSESSISLPLNEEGTFNIGLSISNPLCTLDDELSIVVNAITETTITQTGAEFTAPAGDSWQWYYEGQEIDGATDQNYTAEVSGYYQVFVTNVEGCSAFSASVLFVGLDEQSDSSIQLFPNPMSERTTLVLNGSDKIREIQLKNVSGEIVQSWNTPGNNSVIIEKNEIVAGTYLIHIITESSTITRKLVIN